MITKMDWQTVRDAMGAEERRKTAEPPTAEEMLAYKRGELSAADEARVRELLVLYPELARAVIQPFPPEEALPGDPDFVSEEELSKRWASLQQELHGSAAETAPGGRVLQFWRAAAAVAAVTALLMGGLLWETRRELTLPRVTADVTLPLAVLRGPAPEPVTLPGHGDAVSLRVRFSDSVPYERYRVAIFRAADAREPLWTSEALEPSAQSAFVIVVPRKFLARGSHRVVLYGQRGDLEEQIAEGFVSAPAR